jgi:glycosyltransferase involved in cell wall biosynthesis
MQPEALHPVLGSLESLSVILPAYNEAPNIAQLIPDLAEVIQQITTTWEFIVVNDGSTDNTLQVGAELTRSFPRLRIVSHRHNMGYGHALRTGISEASCEWSLLMDADGQFSPCEIPAMVGALFGCDCVLGVRMPRRDPVTRRILGRIGNWIAMQVLNYRILDVNCGLKLFRTSDLKQMTLRSTGGLISTEILLNCLSSARRIRQLTVTHRPRRRGAQTGGRVHVVATIIVEGLRLLVRRRSQPGRRQVTTNSE